MSTENLSPSENMASKQVCDKNEQVFKILIRAAATNSGLLVPPGKEDRKGGLEDSSREFPESPHI